MTHRMPYHTPHHTPHPMPYHTPAPPHARLPQANMEKKKLLTYHWDSRIPHVGFYANRDIQPNEELTCEYS